jgi:PAS domain S-box-containing protein
MRAEMGLVSSPNAEVRRRLGRCGRVFTQNLQKMLNATDVVCSKTIVMKSELNILMLEDDVNDAELVQSELRRGGLQFRADCVQTRTAFEHALKHNPPDVILSDHGLPSFGGFEAMVLAKKRYPDVPFIFVTGREGEEHQSRAFECGATDYILKTELSRLAPAVNRAVHEADERITSHELELALPEISERSVAHEGVADYVICMLDGSGHLTSWSTGTGRMAGYRAEDVLGRHFSLLYPRESVAVGQHVLTLVWAVTLGRFEENALLVRKDGFPFWAHLIVIPLWDGNEQLRGFAFIACEIPAQRQDGSE